MSESDVIEELLDKVIGPEGHGRPIHALRVKGKAYCGFENDTRIRDLSKIEDVDCAQCLKILGYSQK